MKYYLNTNKFVKPFVLAGVMSVGVIVGGHFAEAAGLEKAKEEPVKTVQVQSPVNTNVKSAHAVPSTPTVPAQSKAKEKDEVKAAGQPEQDVNTDKAQASVQASQTAENHASIHSAIFANPEKNQTEGVKTEEVQVPETAPETTPASDVPAKDETADTNPNPNTEEISVVKTEESEAVRDEENKSEDEIVQTAPVTREDPKNQNEDSNKITLDTNAVVNTKDEEAVANIETAMKINPSSVNKVNSHASLHASDTAKAHANANSAVLAKSNVTGDNNSQTTVIGESGHADDNQTVTNDNATDVIADQTDVFDNNATEVTTVQTEVTDNNATEVTADQTNVTDNNATEVTADQTDVIADQTVTNDNATDATADQTGPADDNAADVTADQTNIADDNAADVIADQIELADDAASVES